MTAADPTCAHTGLEAFQRERAYLGADHRRNERRTWIVTGICAVTLIAQITGGLLFRSMALTASGLHMAAHVAALLAAAGAYVLSRRHATSPRFAFGTGKIGYLAGFANAVVLGMTAVLIAVESIQRLFAPEAVDYASALPLAVAGLAVTLVCVWLLRPTEQGRHDLNISSAHLHLSADALFGRPGHRGLARRSAAGLALGRSGSRIGRRFPGGSIRDQSRAARGGGDATGCQTLHRNLPSRSERDWKPMGSGLSICTFGGSGLDIMPRSPS